MERAEDCSLLIVDDNELFLNRLGRAMESRGFAVTTAESLNDAVMIVKTQAPAYAVIDMRLEDGNGLDLLELIHRKRPDARIVMLTGYGSIITATAAVKAGAVDYLTKPADADDVEKALLAKSDTKPSPPDNPMSADRVRWEHIQRVYELCNRNMSETARRLKMHRRTLQRIMGRSTPR